MALCPEIERSCPHEVLAHNKPLAVSPAQPFRRRGYERDGMLKTVVEHAGELPGPMHVVLVATHASFSHQTTAGFKEIWQASREGTGNRAEALAAVPSAISHVALDALYERPVQAEVVQLLLLPSSHKRFTSCVVVHGMGGTGKTVTAVAAVQDGAVRQHFSQIYWLTVGADAVGETGALQQLQVMLYSQLTGKTVKTEDIHKNDKQAWQQKLVEAIAEKRRALVVLDDPWMPEQVRFLNPIDGSQTSEHRLLVTTRIRDLVPKATRVELPLMGKDEAVALLLDLGNVGEADYLKENPGAVWPPQAAYQIAAECGLLPITLTIAAQVVRSWGEGWGK